MRNLSTCLAALACLASLPAFATGERIIIASSGAASEQLKETLCIAMECVASKDGVEATVTAKAVRNEIEVRVIGPDGAVRSTQHLPALDDGRVSATDLVAATSKVFQAIESPQLVSEQKAQEKAEADRVRAEKKKVKATAMAAKLKKKAGKLLAAR